MSLLAQLIDPIELAQLSERQIELLHAVVHNELITNPVIKEALAPKLRAVQMVRVQPEKGQG